MGPKYHISLLDQHSELKKKAEGIVHVFVFVPPQWPRYPEDIFRISVQLNFYLCSFLIYTEFQ